MWIAFRIGFPTEGLYRKRISHPEKAHGVVAKDDHLLYGEVSLYDG